MARLDNLDYEVNGGTVNYEIVPEIAPLFNATTAYAAGDQVIHEGIRCKFTTAHPAGAWIGTDVEEMPTVAEELTSHGADITNLKADLSELSTDLEDTKNSVYITNTASGAIASFPDGADGVPVKDLVVDIEPVQDLHGQANPYPGGGSKNLFDWSALILGSLDTNGDYVTNNNQNVSDFLVLEAGTYTISRATTANTNYWKLWSYNIDGTGATLVFNNGSSILNNTFTLSEQKKIRIAFDYIVTEADKVQLETGSTATSYVPYSNICPISGWTGANVSRTGKNLLNAAAANEAKKNGGNLFTLTYSDNNTVEMSTSSTGALSVIWEILKVTPNLVGTYLTRSKSGFSGCYFYKTRANDGSWTPTPTSYRSTDTIIQLTENDVGHAIGLGFYNDTGTTKTISNVQVEFGQTATAFEPFTDTTYSITFPTEAGTVYGGTLDVTTGVLTVDKAKVTLDGTQTVQNVSVKTGFTSCRITGFTPFAVNHATNTTPDAICSDALVIGTYYAWQNQDLSAVGRFTINGQYIGISIPGELTDASAVQAYFQNHNVEVCYEIATPVTYQLTPQEVSTLLGLNNIWTDCGDTTVDYRADTKLYIEKLTAPTEDDMVANNTIPDATYFMIGNNLYLSTTTIPAGDTINPGTNCTLMNLASALNALNS